MLCPIDQTELVITDRQGVEIDYCPKCRGVWLDRGELDKIIDRAMPIVPAPAERDYHPQSESRTSRSYREDDDDDFDDDRRYGRKKKKRESFLSDLFDF